MSKVSKTEDDLRKKQEEKSVCIKNLDSHWVSLLTNSWKFCDEGTMKMIRNHVDLGRVFGVFVENELEPVSWMLIYRYLNLIYISLKVFNPICGGVKNIR